MEGVNAAYDDSDAAQSEGAVNPSAKHAAEHLSQLLPDRRIDILQLT